MYKRIMVPVDLAHTDRLEKALASAADLSKHYDIPVSYVAVTATAPGPIAHTPEEFHQKLKGFAADQAKKYGLRDTDAKTITSHDPAVDLHEKLIDAGKELGADLIVMASHVPGVAEHLFESNAGKVALHAEESVFVIR